jgi:CBS domain-containing protein
VPAVIDLLINKGNALRSVPSRMTVLDATKVMNQHLIGAVVVMEDDRIAGIFTERDVLRRIVAEERSPAETLVADVMTRDVLCCAPQMDVEEARSIMKHRRVRHLPVVSEEGNVLGMISIGDLNAHQCSDQELQITYLYEYLHGRT